MNTFSQTISNFKNEKKQNEKKIKKKKIFLFSHEKGFSKKKQRGGRETPFPFYGILRAILRELT